MPAQRKETSPYGTPRVRARIRVAPCTLWHVPTVFSPFALRYAVAIGWALPEREISALSRMDPLIIAAGVIGERLESMVSLWRQEIREPETAAISLLVIQASIRRIIRAAEQGDAIADDATGLGPQRSAGDTASLPGALPSGRTQHVMMCRVTEVQRLLLTTSMTSSEIAGYAGFGLLSSYYAHVTNACAMSPRQYRALGALSPPST